MTTYTRILLQDGLVLKADSNGWTIAEARTYGSGAKAGQSYDHDLWYPGPSLYGALLKLREAYLRRSGADTLEALIEADKRFQKHLSDQLAPRLQVRLG